jgi:hypothetical protein
VFGKEGNYFMKTEAGPRLWCNLSFLCIYARPFTAPWSSFIIKYVLPFQFCPNTDLGKLLKSPFEIFSLANLA